MRSIHRMAAFALVAVPLLALACGNSLDQASPTEPGPQFKHGSNHGGGGGGGGEKVFYVFCTEGQLISDCNFVGAEVAVTPKDKHPNRSSEPIETCIKDDENQNCVGVDTGDTYSRDTNRDWVLGVIAAP